MKKYALMGLIGFALSAVWTQASLVTPWTETFSTDPTLNADYTIGTNGTGTWTYNGITDQFIANGGASNGNYWISATVSDLGASATQDFKMTCEFYTSSSFNQLSLSALAPSGWTTGYQVYFRGNDKSLDIKDGSTEVVIGVTNSNLKVTGDYVLTLTGHYNGEGGLDLTALITDSLGETASVSWTETETLLTGQIFGIGGRAVVNNEVKLNSLTVEAIPEPATLSLFGICGAGVFLLRRLYR